MPYKNPKDRKIKPYSERSEKEREDMKKRNKARYAFDKKYGKSARKGKDLGHAEALAKGGDPMNVRVEDRSRNRAKGGAMNKGKRRKKS